MTVEIGEDGLVLAAGQAVDYATAYTWCIDAPERITVESARRPRVSI